MRRVLGQSKLGGEANRSNTYTSTQRNKDWGRRGFWETHGREWKEWSAAFQVTTKRGKTAGEAAKGLKRIRKVISWTRAQCGEKCRGGGGSCRKDQGDRKDSNVGKDQLKGPIEKAKDEDEYD